MANTVEDPNHDPNLYSYFLRENLDFESCNHIFPEIKSIMLATNILKSVENKKRSKMTSCL